MGYIRMEMMGAGKVEHMLGYISDMPQMAKQALEAGADVLLPKLQEAAPIGPGGGIHIRDRMAVKISRSTAYVGVWYGYTPVHYLSDGTKSHKQDDPPVAYYVEYGHGGPHPAPAHPYMKPTVDAQEDAVTQAIVDAIDDYLMRM